MHVSWQMSSVFIIVCTKIIFQYTSWSHFKKLLQEIHIKNVYFHSTCVTVTSVSLKNKNKIGRIIKAAHWMHTFWNMVVIKALKKVLSNPVHIYKGWTSIPLPSTKNFFFLKCTPLCKNPYFNLSTFRAQTNCSVRACMCVLKLKCYRVLSSCASRYQKSLCLATGFTTQVKCSANANNTTQQSII